MDSLINHIKNFWLFVFVIVISIVLNLPKIDINKQIGPYKINYIGGYEINFNNGKFYRDMSLKKGLDIAGGVRVVLEPDLSNLPPVEHKEALNSLKRILEIRVNKFGINEPNISVINFKNNYKVYVEIPGVKDVDRALSLVGQTAKLSFKIEKEPPKELKEGQIYIPQFEETNLTSSDVSKAVPDFYVDQTGKREPSIKLVFTPEGAKKFAKITRENIGRRLAIYLDNQILIAPVINTEIPTGDAYITGQFTIEQVKDMAIQINSGALPVPVKVVSQTRVGPSVGSKAIKQSVLGGIIGILLVILFMLLNYPKLFHLSVINLVVYGLITITVYKLLPVTLTLPGVAGLILSIGMAEDSNILIFEKINDEIKNGLSKKEALEKGFKGAWSSIRDANIASLIIAFILFNPFEWGFLLNSGPVRGFAVTLGLGIIISLYTSVFLIRSIFKYFYKIKL
ncbi:MAG TPA: protein translocase subunit SecD [candidate division WWE3 bacterium]|uniref:Protein translocase subunit SecD n=1 Tax=candidate division WWE3 bacterium TaxID=2053526 RepID=A0A7V5J083_UNCKA|nr:protein translocase subunit SecD [candidate division WWE3 bacterium]